MDRQQLADLLRENLPHEPTGDQHSLLDRLASFLLQPNMLTAFLLKGYAGTGKTTVVNSIVKTLPLINLKFVLLAPTGRAAKVLAGYTGKVAFTIHKRIYVREFGNDGIERFVLAINKLKHTIFIVDEASMISGRTATGGSRAFGSGNLLDDLMKFVYSGKHCRLIFIGDTAQLPPVHSDLSPALQEQFLEKTYHLMITSCELKQVVRQDQDSGIIENATLLRKAVTMQSNGPPNFKLNGFRDVLRITGLELEDELSAAYQKFDAAGTMVICRSNKRANLFNQQIRARILWLEDEIAAGDLMMVVKNNYYWLKEDTKTGFIANGDIIEILKIVEVEDRYGFRFARVHMRFLDYPEEKEHEVFLLLDTIMVEAPNLPPQRQKELFTAVAQEEEVVASPYFHALQVKFAYAVTCHKAQGGQWDAVFVEQGYLTEEMIDREYLRWLYTAITRPTKELYLVNFSDHFFEEPAA